MTAGRADIAILGAGVAGAALAARLAGRLNVVLIEREPAAGMHATGRSAAMFIPSYGPPCAPPLTAASRRFLFDPPQGFETLVRPRAALHIARRPQASALETFQAAKSGWACLELLDGAQARRFAPSLRRGAVDAALLERDCADIDVDRLHQGFLGMAREAGAGLILRAGPARPAREDGRWRVSTAVGDIEVRHVVNAAGAWADEVALDAGAAARGLRPLRRTAILIAPPPDAGFASRPIVKDIEEGFYCRPFAGRMLVTPCDETLSPPCDCQPEEIDVAVGLARYQAVMSGRVTRVEHRWAGLRTFSPDRAPIIGWDGDAPGFFWLAGLGGFGIQTADAVSRMAAGLLLHGEAPPDLIAQGVDAAWFDPQRRLAAA